MLCNSCMFSFVRPRGYLARKPASRSVHVPLRNLQTLPSLTSNPISIFFNKDFYQSCEKLVDFLRESFYFLIINGSHCEVLVCFAALISYCSFKTKLVEQLQNRISEIFPGKALLKCHAVSSKALCPPDVALPWCETGLFSCSP